MSMKTRILLGLTAILFGCSLCNAQDFKTWRSQSGSTVEAKYVGLKREHLYLENREGNRMKLSLSALAEVDRGHAVARAIKAGHLAPLRTWTSKNGSTVVAGYSHFENNQLTLLKEDGTALRLSLSALADADRNEAVTLALQAGEIPDTGTGAIQEPAGPDGLATFADGKWKGLYAVYESLLYRVRVEPDSTIFIDLLEDGEQVGPSIRNAFGASYRDESKPIKERSVRRKILRTVESPEPAVYQGEAEIVLKGLFEDEVAYSLTLSLKPNELNLTYEIKDPPKVEYETYGGFSMVFPESHRYIPGTQFEETKEALKGWVMKIYRPDVSPQSIAYWESVQTM